MNSEDLIRSTFKQLTYITIPSLPGKKLCLDVADIDEDLSDLAEFVEALDNLMRLTHEELLKAEPYLFEEFKAFEETVDPSCHDVSIDTESQVWAELEFTDINLVRRHYGDKGIYAQLAAECSWDPEHGIQLIYKNGLTLTRVSEQDGHYAHCDAWGLPEDEDRIR